MISGVRVRIFRIDYVPRYGSCIFHSFCMRDKNTRFHSIALSIFKCQFLSQHDMQFSDWILFAPLRQPIQI